MSGSPEDKAAKAPIRLAYELRYTGGSPRFVLSASRPSQGTALSRADIKKLLDLLHPLDVAIVREVAGRAVLGQLSDPELARLLPVLAQRRTMLGKDRLRLADGALRPRARVRPGSPNGLVVRLVLEQEGTERTLDVEDGRLIAGAQAFFLVGARAFPVTSPAPWELEGWAREPVISLTDDQLTPRGRDELVRALLRAGVPDADLRLLAVRRAPPELVIATLCMDSTVSEGGAGEPTAQLTLEAVYAGQRVPLTAQRTPTPYVPMATGTVGTGAEGLLIERDPVAEDEARRVVKSLGFRHERATGVFVARGNAALRALDPAAAAFPLDWQVCRGAGIPSFRRDLVLRTELQLQPQQGLVDLRVDIDAVDEVEQAVAALLSMRDLLAWLHSGQHYVRLGDGSYVAPSKRFREGVAILEELGASNERLLVSPLCVGLLRAIGDRAGLAAADSATEAWLQEVAGSRGPRPVEPPACVAHVLRDYQRRGLDWLMMLHRHRLAGILADDMGLGKTLQTLALLLKLRDEEGPKPSLVVAPTSVVSVWRDEAARFAPTLRIGIYHGPIEVRRTVDVGAVDLLVTSYGILRRDADHLARYHFRYVVLDEAQSAKNASSQNARAVRRLLSERRLALSGTPVENRSEELWATLDFLAPGLLGNLRQFRKRYARPIERGDDQALQLLRARVQPLVLRRLKSEVAKELPPKIESVVRCDMLPAQRALYEHVAGELRESVRRRIAKVGIERAHLDVLAAVTRLRQICCSPSLLPVPESMKAKIPGSAKLELFGELMREALASDRCVVVFSQFVQMQKQLIEVVRRMGVDPLWLHGGTRRRDRVISGFQDPQGPPVIIVSLRAAGTGLTLTRADTVMHYDPWWNPAVERQATDRAHRIGQCNTVTVYKLVCTRSIEERVLEMAADKEHLAQGVLGSDGAGGGKRITRDDVLALLG